MLTDLANLLGWEKTLGVPELAAILGQGLHQQNKDVRFSDYTGATREWLIEEIQRVAGAFLDAGQKPEYHRMPHRLPPVEEIAEAPQTFRSLKDLQDQIRQVFPGFDFTTTNKKTNRYLAFSNKRQAQRSLVDMVMVEEVFDNLSDHALELLRRTMRNVGLTKAETAGTPGGTPTIQPVKGLSPRGMAILEVRKLANRVANELGIALGDLAPAASRVKTPRTKAYVAPVDPVAKVEEPVAKVEEPVAKVEEPVAKVEDLETPVNPAKQLVLEVQKGNLAAPGAIKAAVVELLDDPELTLEDANAFLSELEVAAISELGDTQVGIAALAVESRITVNVPESASGEADSNPSPAETSQHEVDAEEALEENGESDYNDAGGAQTLEDGDRRATNSLRDLFKILRLDSNYGMSFAMKAIQQSVELPALLVAGTELRDVWAASERTPEDTAKLNDALLALVVAHKENPNLTLEERQLMSRVTTTGKGRHQAFKIIRDLSVQLDTVRTRAVFSPRISLDENKEVSIDWNVHRANLVGPMAASLESNLYRELGTPESARPFLDLISSLKGADTYSVYAFWSALLGESVDTLRDANVQIGQDYLDKDPRSSKSADASGPLFRVLFEPKGWIERAERASKALSAPGIDRAAVDKSVAQLVEFFLYDGMVAFKEDGGTSGSSYIQRLVAKMGVSEAPTGFRRLDGTFKNNALPHNQLTYQIELARLAQEANNEKTGEENDSWSLASMDMVEGIQGVVEIENLSEVDLAMLDSRLWAEAVGAGRVNYHAWAGPLGDKSSRLYVSLPVFSTSAEALDYYTKEVWDKLTPKERAFEEVLTPAALSRLFGPLEGNDAARAFEINDYANRIRIQKQINGDLSKFGDAVSHNKRASTTGSVGFNMRSELFGDTHIHTVTVSDPKFLDMFHAQKLEEANAELAKLKKAKKKSSKLVPSTAQDRRIAELEEEIAAVTEFKDSVEATDGFALILPKAMERMAWAFGSQLTQEDRYGPLAVMKALRAGVGGLDKFGAGVLTPEFAGLNAKHSGFYQDLLDMVNRHQENIAKQNVQREAAGQELLPELDMIFFSSGDKANSKNSYDVQSLKEGAMGKPDFTFPGDSLGDVPLEEFFWLLSASHDTLAVEAQMPVQLAAVMSEAPAVFQNVVELQNATADSFVNSAGKILSPKNLVTERDHPLLVAATTDKNIPFVNPLTRLELAEAMARYASKKARPKSLSHQATEQPLAADAGALINYIKMEEGPEGPGGFWTPVNLSTPGAAGMRTRLARVDANVDNARFSITLNGKTEDGSAFMDAITTPAKAHEALLNPDLFKIFIDMFEIPPEYLESPEAMKELFKDEAAKAALTFKYWELEYEDGFVVVPGEPVLIQRIPSDNIYSTSMSRLNRRLLNSDGTSPNVIQTTMDMQLGAGADFDIDKRFMLKMMRYELDVAADEIQESDSKEVRALKTLRSMTYHNPVGAKKAKSYDGFDLAKQRYLPYNRLLMSIMDYFENGEHFDRVTYRMDHGDLKPLVDEATADKKGSVTGPAAMAFTSAGANRLYAMNSAGKAGLGRAATALYAANVMHGMGYGVRNDLSFEFNSEHEEKPVEIKINRKPGEVDHFFATKNMIGLVLNNYTDYTKMQAIDKIGGDQFTASLFATLLYANADIKTKGQAIEYMRSIWRLLESPYIQAWVAANKLETRLNPSESDVSIQQEQGKADQAMAAYVAEFGQDPVAQKIIHTVIGLSEEMFGVGLAFKGYSSPLAINPKKADFTISTLTALAEGANIRKTKKGDGYYVKYNMLQLPIDQNPLAALGYPKKLTAAARERVRKAPNGSRWFEASLKVKTEVRNRAIRDLGIDELRNTIIDALRHESDTSAFNLDDLGMARMLGAIDRIVFTAALLNEVDVAPHELNDAIMSEIDDVLNSEGLESRNKFLTEAIVRRFDGSENLIISVIPGTGKHGQSADKIAEYQEAFERLPHSLQVKLMLYAVTKYGTGFHTGFGSFLPYVSPASLAPILTHAEDYVGPKMREELDWALFSEFLGQVSQSRFPIELPSELANVMTDVGSYQQAEPAVTKSVERAAASTSGVNKPAEMSAGTAAELESANALTADQLEEVGPTTEQDTPPVSTKPASRSEEQMAASIEASTNVTRKDWALHAEWKDAPRRGTGVVSHAVAAYTLAEAGEGVGISPASRRLIKALKPVGALLVDSKFGSAAALEEALQFVYQIRDEKLREFVADAVTKYAQTPIQTRKDARKAVAAANAEIKRQAAVQLAATEEATISTIVEEFPSITREDIDNPSHHSFVMTEMIDAATAGMESRNHFARNILMSRSRAVAELEVHLTADALRWRTMTKSRGAFDSIKGKDRAGEKLLKILGVMYESGLLTSEDIKTSTVNEWNTNAEGARAPQTVHTATRVFYFDPETARIRVEIDHRGREEYIVHEEDRFYVEDVLRDYNEARMGDAKLAPWEDVMADFAGVMGRVRGQLNAVTGFDKFKEPRDPVTGETPTRVFHTQASAKKKLFTVSEPPNRLGRGIDEYRDSTMGLQRLFRTNRYIPVTFNIAEAFSLHVTEALSAARVQSVLGAVAASTDVEGVPGLVVGTTDTTGKVVAPFSHEEGFTMLRNLRKKLLEAGKSADVKSISPGGDPWLQAAAMADANVKLMYELGYVKLTNHALGAGVDQLWVVSGVTSLAVRHVATAGFRGRAQMHWKKGERVRASFLFVLQALLDATKTLKMLNVSISGFHTLALAESAVGNVGVTFKTTIFAPIFYAMSTIKGYNLYREMTRNPEIEGKWEGMGLKASVVPIDSLQFEMSQRWFSRAGHFIKKHGKAPGRAVGSVVLAAGNFKKYVDNLLWHGMVPVMKVSMAESMFKRFREMPDLAHLTDAQLGSDVAAYVNDALGGQEWERYLIMNPLMQDIANMLWFAPDWTISALNVAGVSKIMGDLFNIEGSTDFSDQPFDFSNSPMVKHRMQRYLPGFIWSVLVAPPVVIQAAIFAVFGGDEDEEWFTFFNEKGKKGLINITPAVRFFRDYWGAEGEIAQVYLVPGKQLREVQGWLDPGHTLTTMYGKSSNLVKMANLVLADSKSVPLGKNPWKVKPEDKWMEVFKSTLPFSLSGWWADTEVAFPFRVALTVNRGPSRYALSRDAADIYRDMVAGKGAFRGKTGAAVQFTLEREMRDIRRSAKLNHVNLAEVQKGGRKAVRSELNGGVARQLLKKNPNWSRVVDDMKSLRMLADGAKAAETALNSSLKPKAEGSGSLSDKASNRLRESYESSQYDQAWRDANSEFRMDGLKGFNVDEG